ncbi:MAG TPA: hypothetical protein VF880_02590 [Actinomycetes bacterium]
MSGRRRMAWRLAGSGALALLLMAGCAALGPDASRRAATPATSGPAPAASGAPAASRSLPPGPAGRSAGGPVMAVVGGQGRELAELDPNSLRPLPGRRLALTNTVGGYAWSPDGSTLVLGDSDTDALLLIDARRMRTLGKLWLDVPNSPQWLGWLGPRRLLAVVDQPLRDPDANLGDTAVVLVDPLERRVLRRQNLHSGVQTAVFDGDRGVLLTTPSGGIGMAGLAVVEDQGTVRSVPLRAISAGDKEPTDQGGSEGVMERREVGLAVDRAGGRAFVVAAGTPVAEVDLATLRVTYHGLSQPASLLQRLAGWFVPAAEAKLASGPLRSACWLGDGLLAVWGSDARVVKDAGGEPTVQDTPSGLKLVDTRRWTVTPLHPEATAVRWHDGRLFAFGVRWYEQERPGGIGLTIYGPGDRGPRQLIKHRPVHELDVNGDLAYAITWGSSDAQKSEVAVVDLPSGRVRTTIRGEPPYLLLDTDGSAC